MRSSRCLSGDWARTVADMCRSVLGRNIVSGLWALIRPPRAQPLPPTRCEAERLLRLRVRRPAEPGAVVNRVLADGRPGLLLAEHRRGGRPDGAGERGQPGA